MRCPLASAATGHGVMISNDYGPMAMMIEGGEGGDFFEDARTDLILI